MRYAAARAAPRAGPAHASRRGRWGRSSQGSSSEVLTSHAFAGMVQHVLVVQVTYQRYGATGVTGPPLTETTSLLAPRTCSTLPSMGTPVIVEAVRTPIGKRNGWLAGLHPARSSASRRPRCSRRAGIDSDVVEQVVGGCVTQAGEQSNDIVRRAWLHAGLPQRPPATTIDGQCGSAQQANHFIADLIAAGAIDAGIACGVEHDVARAARRQRPPGPGDPRPDDWDDRPAEPVRPAPTGSPAHRGISREDLDAFGLASQRKAARRGRRGPLHPRDRRRSTHRCSTRTASRPARPARDDRPGPARDHRRGPRRARSRAARGGLHTAGTSSQISDGASAVLLMDEERARDARPHAARPDRRARRWSAPTPTTTSTARSRRPEQVLARTGMSIADIDLFEVNEAFASVVLSWAQVHKRRHGQGQRQRRRDRPRPPGRLDRHPAASRPRCTSSSAATPRPR